jgi:hypothetical protein
MRYLLLLLILLSSCNVLRKKTENTQHTRADSSYTILSEKETVQKLPGQALKTSFDIDSLVDALKGIHSPTVFRPVVIKDANSKAEMKLYKDTSGRLQTEFSTPEQHIVSTNISKQEYRQKENTTTSNTEAVKEPFRINWWMFAFIALIFAIGLFSFRN